MPTINDLRQQAATIKNATQVGENTATRVGTTFETIADLLEGASVGQGVPSVDLSQLNALRTPSDQTTAICRLNNFLCKKQRRTPQSTT